MEHSHHQHDHHHHGHDHHHHTVTDLSTLNRAFYIGIGLNLLYTIILLIRPKW